MSAVRRAGARAQGELEEGRWSRAGGGLQGGLGVRIPPDPCPPFLGSSGAKGRRFEAQRKGDHS